MIRSVETVSRTIFAGSGKPVTDVVRDAYSRYEHMFATVPAVGDPVDDILRIATLTMSDDQADRLIGWIALRTGHSKALAVGDDTIDRLRHVAQNWLDHDQCRRLAGWITRRVALNEDPVPPAPSALRQARGESGTLTP